MLALALPLTLVSAPLGSAGLAAEASASEPPKGQVLDRIVFRNDGSWLRVTIPLQGSWHHRMFEDPPRIVVDLDRTTSHLPKAPGLFQARLDRGPVVLVRTSQFRYTPKEQVVRVTLELSAAVPYQAMRTEDGIEIRIPDAARRDPPALVLGSNGLTAVTEDHLSALRSPPTGPPADRGLSGAGGSSNDPHVFEHYSAAETEPDGSGPLEEAGRWRADRSAARTLREAVEALVGRRNVDEGDDPPRGAPSRTGAQQSGAPAAPASPQKGSSRETSRETTGRAGIAEYDPYASHVQDASVYSTPAQARPELDAGAGQGPEPGTGREPDPVAGPEAGPDAGSAAGPDAEPDAGPDPETGTGSGVGDIPPYDDRAQASEYPASESTLGGEGSSGSEAAGSTTLAVGPLHAARASRLFSSATEAWDAGDDARAISLLRRTLEFYPSTPAGSQAGLLLRQLLLLRGELSWESHDTAALPDTAILTRAIFLRLIEQHRRKPDLMEVDRLLREWAPRYGELPELNGIHLALGRAYLEAGSIDLARQHLEAVPAGAPEETEALTLLARSYERAGEAALALELYQRLSIMPDSPGQLRAMARRADLHFQAGEVGEALAVYEDVLGREPPNDERVWATYQTGNCLLLMGETGEARERYRSVAERWPRSFWADFARKQLQSLEWEERVGRGQDARKATGGEEAARR